MKKLWLVSAAVVALSGSMFGDAIWSGSTGTLTGNTLGLTSAYAPPNTVAWTGSPVNLANTQTPFWNNPSGDNLVDGHVANVGDVLGGLATGTNLIGSDLTGTPSTVTPNTGTQINGSYYSLTNNASGGDPVNAASPTVSGSTVSETSALEFSFLSSATSYNIALLFADSMNNTGLASNGTVFGYYTGSGSSISLHQISGPISNNITGVPTSLATNDVLEPNNFVYGFYATVCQGVNTNNVCNESITYTTGAGNFSNNLSSSNALLGSLGWNHFALFELASGAEVLGFEDTPWSLTSGLAAESIGDFNDLVIELTPPVSSVPEPGTMGILGLSLAGLGFLGRRRYAKK